MAGLAVWPLYLLQPGLPSGGLGDRWVLRGPGWGGGGQEEELAIVMPAPPQSPVAHTHTELGGNIRGSFPGTVGRGGGEEG